MKISRRTLLQSSAALGALALDRPSLALGRTGIDAVPAGSGAWQPRAFARKPNIVIAVLDDVGFGDLGCYGSDIKTDCIDTIAAQGVRYNNFHVTALCAPTRACLLTGRNAHAVGVGNIAEWGREDHPGYKGWIRPDALTLAEMLRPAGYNTFAVGKWHLAVLGSQGAMGPFDQWPTSRGFDHWYGFHGSAADHWHPELFRDASAVYPDKTRDYHLTVDLVDQSIAYLRDHQVVSPDSPFFLYLALGACHFPYHVPQDYMARYSGRYDAGWDTVRAARFERQREIGILPGNAELAPRNPGVPAWAEVSVPERQFSQRTQEAYAGFLNHADDQLQRLIDFLAKSGELDNTILMVMSDNGAGSWAPPAGRLDVFRTVYISPEPIEELTANIDKVGTEESQPSYSPGWAQVSNTPLKWYKGNTYEGGIRAPLIIHWPAGELPVGAILGQYHHAIDIVPTLLEMTGLVHPTETQCETVLPLQGLSLAYTLDNPTGPTHKVLQYFETSGDRAIWAEGWKAVTKHQSGAAFEQDQWALYHAAADFSEIHDLSVEYPDRLEQLVQLWRHEAEQNNVLPLEDDLAALFAAAMPQPRAEYIFYPGATRLERLRAPDIFNFDYRIRAEVVLGDQPANGVLLASGDSMAGYEFLMRNGWLEYTYIYTRGKKHTLRADSRPGAGGHILELRGKKTGPVSGRVEMVIDGEIAGAMDIPEMWQIKALNAGVRCGENRGAPVSHSYKGQFRFDQQLERVVFNLEL